MFRHFRKEWSVDPNTEIWSLSVHENLLEEAILTMTSLKDNIREEHGEEVVKHFFKTPNTRFERQSRKLSFEIDEDDDDDWFTEDEEIKNLQEKGILIEGFEEAFNQIDNNDTDAPTWGSPGRTELSGFTRNTEGTATRATSVKEARQETQKTQKNEIATRSTSTPSSITDDGYYISEECIQQRKEELQKTLNDTYNFTGNEITEIVQNTDKRFNMIFTSIDKEYWNNETAANMISTIQKSYKQTIGTGDKSSIQK